MDENKNKLDIRVLTREYSSELERAISGREYLRKERGEEEREEETTVANMF
ncbi:hypothetical protein [Candidatus Endomicrobiellum devescovinae]|jgi:hypothetical protein|uniref:hypothetical protein n=1 Tax=Candidatus Endomicrobiellum devescovinae TaxID=3242322 RepID=UPI00282F3608|nr:hypothetical protein [Endomicrobium sp.]